MGSGEGTDRERQKSITVGASSPMKLKAQTILGTSTRYDSATSQHDPMPSVPPTQRRGCRNEWKRRAHKMSLVIPDACRNNPFRVPGGRWRARQPNPDGPPLPAAALNSP